MNAKNKNRGFTLIELLVVVVILGVLFALLFPVIGRANEAGKRTTCMNNLHQIGMALQMYADDHDGIFPLLDPADWVANKNSSYNHLFAALYPNYINEFKIFACPSDEDGYMIDRLTRVNWSYYYFVVEWPQDPTGTGFNPADLTANKRLSSKSASNFPVAMDCQSFNTPEDNNHGRKDIGPPAVINGGNVLFIDGHVTWCNYGTYPSTESVIKKFDEYYSWF